MEVTLAQILTDLFQSRAEVADLQAKFTEATKIAEVAQKEVESLKVALADLEARVSTPDFPSTSTGVGPDMGAEEI